MKLRRIWLVPVLLLSGCGGHPDREAVSALLEDLRPGGQFDFAEIPEYSGSEFSVREFTPLYLQQQQVLEEFLAEHPEITPSTRQLAESVRDALKERAEIRTRMIEQNRFDWTSEEAARDRELARQHLEGMSKLMKIVDGG